MTATVRAGVPDVGTDADWRRLYRSGAVSAFAFVALVLVPIGLVFAAPVPPPGGPALLEYIAAHKVVYLAELVCFVGLAVPALIVFAALAVGLRRVEPSLALLGGLLGVASETIALALGSSPQSLHGGVVLLADDYARTSDPAARQALVGAADALAAATNAVTWAGILTAAAILVLSTVFARAGFGVARNPRRRDRCARHRVRGVSSADRAGVPALRAAAAAVVRARRGAVAAPGTHRRPRPIPALTWSSRRAPLPSGATNDQGCSPAGRVREPGVSRIFVARSRAGSCS